MLIWQKIWHKAAFVQFVKYFFGCLVCMYAARLLTSEAVEFSRDVGYMLLFALILTTGAALWHYNRTLTILSAAFVAQYLAVVVTKNFFAMIMQEREITHTLCLAVLLFVSASFALYVAKKIPLKIVGGLLKTLAILLYILFILPPLMFIGYAVVNKAIFSADILLTFFQTNPSEIWAYLQYQNVPLWITFSLLIATFAGVQTWVFSKLTAPQKFNGRLFVLLLALLVYAGSQKLLKLNLSFAVNIAQNTVSALQSFEDFSAARQKRAQNLAKLRDLGLSSPQKGVYVLIIGESETRDHMQVYGYPRPTTPWLTHFAQNPNTFLYTNAYANHTHTVPTLTYALSAKNQYNQVNLADAYSLVEVAKAAGYKVFWLSNQSKFSISETPITATASLADFELWINNNIGDKLTASYYDEQLVKELPDMQKEDKALIILHLMGNHSSYRDRYPQQYDKFGDTDKHIDEYDNSILYNDEVLRQIYEKISQNPHFMAWIYFSDHGDDPDNELGHECSRFSYRMARIPLIVNVSEHFKQTRAADYKYLKNHTQQYWTNDLAYDLMLGLLDIEGKVGADDKYDLTSPQYTMPADHVLLLHGEKKLDGETNEPLLSPLND